MKELKIGRVLFENRHRKGITQEELAKHLGVSKASVSKWETGTSYPDIFMLPRLASYFDMSIDELIGYEPQMETADIRRLYRRLSAEFAERPFETVMEECTEIVKKYYSCYPLLFEIAALFLNHYMMADSQERSLEIIRKARGLFRRVRDSGDDPVLAREALQMEAYCCLILSEPEKVPELLERLEPFTSSPEPLLASAYQMTGNRKEAEKVLQAGMYKNIVALLNLHVSYMGLCTDAPETFAETCRRVEQMIFTFELKHLHPGQVLTAYIAMAQGWALLGEQEKALENLEKYTELAAGGIYPLRLRGDAYFNRLEEWIDESLDTGEYPPRDEAVIRHSMTDAVTGNPAFQAYAENPRFRRLVKRLRENEEKSGSRKMKQEEN